MSTASIVTVAVPARLPTYTEDDFDKILIRVLSFFIIIMFVPPVYRTTYRIVQEKDSKVKESMRMMGLQDFAYWSSWYTYYTLINTAISVISWAILYNLVFSKTAWWILLAMLWLFG